MTDEPAAVDADEADPAPEADPEVDAEPADEADVCETCGEAHPDGTEIRADAAEDLAEAHIGAAAFVTLPREDNDVESLDASTAMFLLDDEMSEVEVIACHTVVEDALEDLVAQTAVPSMVGSSDEPEQVAAMPAPEELMDALVGGGAPADDGDDTDSEATDQRGFE
jgi:hypothetical protein